jgi:hypothetical protein
MSIDTYVVAVKREKRGIEPADWKERIAYLNGVQVLSDDSSRLQIRASDEAVNRFLTQWGHLFHVERRLAHTL